MSTLKAESLYLKYNYGAQSLTNVSFAVKSGEVLTVFAPAQGGKTSLIKGLAGLYPFERGSAFLDGEDITKLPVEKRRLSVFYSDLGLIKGKTVLENIIFPLKLRKIENAAAKESADKAIEEFGLEICKDVKARELSKYEAFKTALARMSVRQSALYLIDNPLSGFDNAQRQELYGTLEKTMEKLSQDAPIIYATDNIDDLEKAKGDVLILNYGAVLGYGNYESLAKKPESLFCYKLFHPNVIIETAQLTKSENGVSLNAGGKKVYIEEDGLINSIYIGSEIIAAYLAQDSIMLPTLRLFDTKSEKLIYFG